MKRKFAAFGIVGMTITLGYCCRAGDHTNPHTPPSLAAIVFASNTGCSFPIVGTVWAATPSRAFVYRATCDNRVGNTAIGQFRRRRDGTLTQIGKPVSVSGPVGNLIVEPRGHYLYVILQSGIICYYHIAQTGALVFYTEIDVAGTYDFTRLDDGTLVATGPHSDGFLTFNQSGRRAHLYHTNYPFMRSSKSMDVEYRVLANGDFREIKRTKRAE